MVTLGMVQAPRCACLPFAFLALIFLMPVLLPQLPKSLFFDLQTMAVGRHGLRYGRGHQHLETSGCMIHASRVRGAVTMQRERAA